MLTVRDVLLRTSTWLGERGCASPRLDAELLLGHVLDLDRVSLYLHFDRPLEGAELTAVRALVARRGRREPVATIVGHKEFWSLDLAVRPGVLVPRPDTETLVRAAISLLPEEREIYVADIGCGSGAIGLAIGSERPGARIYAVDTDETALACTRENVGRLGMEARVAVLRGSGLSPIPTARPVDLVVCNPPYIPSAEIEALEREVRAHEPRSALDGGPDGLRAYREMVPEFAARARLAVLLEVGAGQAEAVSEICAAAGLTGIRTHADLGGIARVVEARPAGNGREQTVR